MNYREASAQNQVDYDDAGAQATETDENAVADAAFAYSAAASGANLAGASAAIGFSASYGDAVAGYAATLADINFIANKTFVDTLAEKAANVGVLQVDAIALMMKESASQTPASNFADSVNTMAANATYQLTVAQIDGNAAWVTTLIGEEKTFRNDAADAELTLETEFSEQQKIVDEAFAAANMTFSKAIADAELTFDKEIATATRDQTVADAEDFATAIIAQYQAAADVYETFASVIGVQQTIAVAQGDLTWVTLLGAAYVTQQTTIADAANDYENKIADQLKTLKHAVADAVFTYDVDRAAAGETSTTARANATKTAQLASSNALFSRSATWSGATTTKDTAIAVLHRDAKINAGYGGNPQIDTSALGAIQSAFGTTTGDASDTFNAAMDSAQIAYRDQLALASKSYGLSGADAGYELGNAELDALNDFYLAENDASRDYDKEVIDADADYAIATVNAVVAGYYARYARHSTPENIAAALAAAAAAPEKIATINENRTEKKDAADLRHTEQIVEINDQTAADQAGVTAARDAAKDEVIARYDEELATAPSGTLPSIETPERFGRLADIRSVAGQSVNELIQTSLFGQSLEELALVGGVAEGAFTPPGGDAFYFAFNPMGYIGERIRPYYHEVLDVIGLIPGVGVFADTINGTLYAIEGDYLNAGLSFGAAIPLLGYGFNIAKYGSKGVRLLKATRTLDKTINLGQSAYAIGQGGNQIAKNPQGVGGYVQVGLGVLGVRANRFGGCFVEGTLVMLPPVPPEMVDEPQLVYAGFGENEVMIAVGVIAVGALTIVKEKKRKQKQVLQWTTDSVFRSFGLDEEGDLDSEKLRAFEPSWFPSIGLEHQERENATLEKNAAGPDTSNVLPYKPTSSPPNPSIITPTVSRTPDPIELSGAPLDSKRSSITENFLPMLFGVALVFLVMFGWSFYDAGHPGTGHDQAGRQETLISTTSHQASIASASRFASIEQIRLGWRVETGISNAERREAIGIESDAPWWDRRDTVIEQSDWRHVSMSVTNRDGSQVEVHLLRPMSWLQEESVTVGGTIHLQLTELGVDGPALIQSINECPTIQPGLGRVVIGRFIHRRDGVMWMKLSDVGKPIGITDTHHVYSVDRGEFLPAGQLQVGETLKLYDRLTQITSLTPNVGTHQVFNLEVQGEHVFRVTTSGLLVHNTCGNVSKGKGDFDAPNPGASRSLRFWITVLRRTSTNSTLVNIYD